MRNVDVRLAEGSVRGGLHLGVGVGLDLLLMPSMVSAVGRVDCSSGRKLTPKIVVKKDVGIDEATR